MDIKKVKQRRIVSELLDEIGYRLMANHARGLESWAVLKGYASLVKHEAKKRGEKSVIKRLNDCGILN